MGSSIRVLPKKSRDREMEAWREDNSLAPAPGPPQHPDTQPAFPEPPFNLPRRLLLN